MKISKTPSTLDPNRLTKVVSKEKIQQEIEKMAARLNERFKDETVVLVGVLNGAYMFLSDLCRRLTMPNVIDFVAFSSYQNNLKMDTPELGKDLKYDVEGQHVVVVEDMIDTGSTMHNFLQMLKLKKPKSVTICLVSGFTPNLEKGFEYMKDMSQYLVEYPMGYLVGYGFDDGEFLRNKEDIYLINPS